MRLRTWILIAALASPTIAVTTSAFANEQDGRTVKLSDIPAPAREGLLREAKGAPILKVEEEHVGDQMTYEAHINEKGGEIGIVVDRGGNLLGRHSEAQEKE